jgi:UDP:flavonoid glycosyltransferase YjiC (YdhE family)
VSIGFGRLAPAEGERLGELIATTVARVGVRAVVQVGWAGLAPAGPDALAVDELPHEWLLPRLAVVVHHAGVGTTGAGLRAGVPAIAVSVMADQPSWAERLHRLGIGPPPAPFASLIADAPAGAMTAAINQPWLPANTIVL